MNKSSWISFRLTPEEKALVAQRGGGAYLRGLIANDTAQREEAATDSNDLRKAFERAISSRAVPMTKLYKGEKR